MKSDKRAASRAEKKAPPRPHKKSAVAVGYSKKSALLEEAITQMNAGKYGRTSAALKELLALDPHNTEARRLYATLHLRLGNLMTARAAFDSLAQEAIQRQDYWLAESLLREYLAAGPRCVPFLELLGHVYEEKGDKGAAVVEYGKAIEFLLEDPDTDRPNRAQELYDLIHTLAPTSPVTAKMGPLIAEHAAKPKQTTEGKRAPATEESPAVPGAGTYPSDAAPPTVMPWEIGAENVILGGESASPGIDTDASGGVPPLPLSELAPDLPQSGSSQQAKESGGPSPLSTGRDEPVLASAVADPRTTQTALDDSPEANDSQPVRAAGTVDVPGKTVSGVAADGSAGAPEVVHPSIEPDQKAGANLSEESPSASPIPSDQQAGSALAFLKEAFRLVTGTQGSEGTRPGPSEESSTSTVNPPFEISPLSLSDRLGEAKSTAKSWEAVLGKSGATTVPDDTASTPAEDAQRVEQTGPCDQISPPGVTVTDYQPSDKEVPTQSADQPVAAVSEAARVGDDGSSTSPESISAPMPWEQVVETSVPIPPPPEPEPIAVDSTQQTEPPPESSVPPQIVEGTTTRPVVRASTEVPVDRGIESPKEDGTSAGKATLAAADGTGRDEQAWTQVESPNAIVDRSEPTVPDEPPRSEGRAALTDSEASLQPTPSSASGIGAVPAPASSFTFEPPAITEPHALQEPVAVEPDLSPTSLVFEPGPPPAHLQEFSAEPAQELSPEQLAEPAYEAQSHQQYPVQEEETTSWAPPDQETGDTDSHQAAGTSAWSGSEQLEEQKIEEPEPSPVTDRRSLWARWIKKSPTEDQSSGSVDTGEPPEEPVFRTWEPEPQAYPSHGHAASAVDVLFDGRSSSSSFERTTRRRRSKVALRISASLARLRFAVLIFLQTGFSTTRAIVLSLILLVGGTAAVALLTVGIVGVGWIVQEEKPSKPYQNLGTMPQRVLADPTKNGYLFLMGFDAPASENIFQVWLEQHSRGNHAELAAACLSGGGEGDGQSSATAMAIQGLFQSADPVRDIHSQAGSIRSWLKQYGTEMARYRQMLKLPFEDWGYGQSMSPNCPLVLATHRLYIAEGLTQDLEEGLNRLEVDMAAWRAAMARARTLPVKMLALDGLNDDVGIISSLLMQHDLDIRQLPRLTKLVRPLDQSEQSLRWPMQSEFVAATRSIHADIRSHKQGDRPWYAAVVSAMPLPKQRRLNRYADYYEAAAKVASELPRQSLPKLSAYVRTPAERWTDYLANPIELLVGVKPLPAWDPYSGRIFEMEARLRLVSLQAWIRKDAGSGDVAARVAQAGQSFYDPFTGLPMLINHRQRALYSVGANRKDDGADPARDVVVAIPTVSSSRDKPVTQGREQ